MRSSGFAARLSAAALAATFLAPSVAAASPGDAMRAIGPIHDVGAFRDAARSASQYRRTPLSAKATCHALKGTTYADNTTITSAALSKTASGTPFCDALGTIEGTIAFELALPVSWNARLFVVGNGGFAGEPLTSYSTDRDMGVDGGFTYAHSNTGHYGSSVLDATWAAGDPQAVLNWANRSVHVLTAAAKLVVAAYYGSPAVRAYYDGCSTGGQQAYTEAEKYPDDFDGIVGGDPNLGGANTFTDGMYITKEYNLTPVTAAEIAPVANAIMAECDGLDGLMDGIISDPRRCTFFPKKMGKGLTPAQLHYYEKYFRGLYNKYGFLEYGGAPGAEFDNGLVGIIIPAPPLNIAAAQLFAEGYAQYIAPFPFTGNYFSIPNFRPSVDPYRMAAIASIDDADSPDMRAFFKHGGKFVGYHGWADPLIPPWFTVSYVESAFAFQGIGRTRASYREFMVPGMGHCIGTGYGANVFDPLTPLIDWVEKGVVPKEITATRYDGSGNVLFTRKLCAYPEEAVYQGGNANKEQSFACRPGLRGTPYPNRGRPLPVYPNAVRV